MTPCSPVTIPPLTGDHTPPSLVTIHNTKEGYESMKPKEQREIAQKSCHEIAADLAKGNKPTLDEILRGVERKGGRYTSTVLANLWRGLHRIRDTHTFIPEMSLKQKSQFVQMAKKAPEGDDVVKAMCKAVLNWDSFTLTVKQSHGHANRPKAPTIDYFLKYIADAVNMAYTDETVVTKVTTEKLELTEDYIPTENTEVPMSKEEVLESLKDL